MYSTTLMLDAYNLDSLGENLLIRSPTGIAGPVTPTWALGEMLYYAA